MADGSSDDGPPRRRRRRGYYMWLEPDQPFDIPHSTQMRWEQRRARGLDVPCDMPARVEQQDLVPVAHLQEVLEEAAGLNVLLPVVHAREQQLMPVADNPAYLHEVPEEAAGSTCMDFALHEHGLSDQCGEEQDHLMQDTAEPVQNVSEDSTPQVEGVEDDSSGFLYHDGPSSISANSSPAHSLSDFDNNTQAGENQGTDSNNSPGTSNNEADSDNNDIQGSARDNIREMLDHEQVPRVYKEQYEWDNSLIPGVLSTTRFEAYLMILHLVMKHGKGGPLIEDLIRFVNVLLGETVLPESKYLFKKMFAPQSDLLFHFFCNVCQRYLGEKKSFAEPTVSCDNCGEENKVESLENSNFFITLSLRDQIQELLKRPDLKLISSRVRQDDGFIRDIFDGDLYKLLSQPGNPLSDVNSLSVTFNTDGACRFKSGKTSVWPIQLYLNEVIPQDRFNCENMMLAGVWFGRGSPLMSTFLKPFVSEMNDLATNGVQRVLSNGNAVTCSVYAIIASVDSVAKPKIQSIKQFNGAYGCGYCLHPNIPVQEAGNHGRYVASHRYPYRSHDSMETDMIEANRLLREGKLVASKKGTPEETLDHVNGLTGLSILLKLAAFHIVFGFIIDYMHAVLEGVIKRLVDLWLEMKYNGKKIINEEDLLRIDERLGRIKPPNVMSRRSRGLSDRGDWKAREWRGFLLYYSLPCLQDILPEKHFLNLKCLVTAIFILLKDKISSEDLKYADRLLQKFVRDFNILYGDTQMVYNVHICTHLSKIVELWGPLWAYSNFVFESGNGLLLKLVNGTRGVATQICEKFLTVRMVSKYLKKYNVSDRVLHFCSSIFCYEYVKNSAKFDGVTVLGGKKMTEWTAEECNALEEGGIDHLSYPVVFYNRAVREKVLYYSGAYKKPSVFNDTCVALVDGSYAIIHRIVSMYGSESLWAMIKPIRIATEDNHPAPHIVMCAFNVFAPLKVVPFSFIAHKSIFIEVNDNKYISDFPNMYERD